MITERNIIDGKVTLSNGFITFKGNKGELGMFKTDDINVFNKINSSDDYWEEFKKWEIKEAKRMEENNRLWLIEQKINHIYNVLR